MQPIPGLDDIFKASPIQTGAGTAIPSPTLGGLISSFLNLALYAAFFLTIFWGFWGVFEYLFAGGDKEKLGKARSRITWALVGFVIVTLAFAISQYIHDILPPNDVPIAPISIPRP